MATLLKQVLQTFEESKTPLSMAEMAERLGVEPGVLDGLIDYWVRKGRLRQTGTPAARCGACGHQNGCPYVVALPRRYELTEADAPPPCLQDDAAADIPPSCCH